MCDTIVCVSDVARDLFVKRYPHLHSKTIAIENLLSKEMILREVSEFSVSDEISDRKNGEKIIFSIGRFSEAKNFDNVPKICRHIIEMGVSVKWYIIGFGTDEKTIRKNIVSEKMEDHVILLGRKSNPYPYIAACDVYIQPSRYEGKSVAVREAQLLNIPVVITNYPTSKAQLEDKVDGIIVPLDNFECANGIVSLLKNRDLMQQLKINMSIRDYTNRDELKKIENLII